MVLLKRRLTRRSLGTRVQSLVEQRTFLPPTSVSWTLRPIQAAFLLQVHHDVNGAPRAP